MMNEKNLARLKELVKTYYGTEKLEPFVSTLRGSEKKTMEALIRGEVTDETDEAVLHSIQVLTVRQKQKNNPYGYYHK